MKTRCQKKPAAKQPAMKEPLKTGRVSIVRPSLLRRFPCDAPADTTISTTDSMTTRIRKSSRSTTIFSGRFPASRAHLAISRRNEQL